MLCICPRSGNYWRTSNFRFGLTGPVTAMHPIFSASRSQLLALSDKLLEDQLEESEAKLVFLALLNSTEMVEWKAQAKISITDVMMHSEGLLRFVAWFDNTWRVRLRLPKLVINDQTSKLKDIGNWLNTWYESKKDYQDRILSRLTLEQEWEEQEAQQQREAKVLQVINSSAQRKVQHIGVMAAWALKASKAPEALVPYWTELFKSRAPEIFKLRHGDLEELQDHMEAELDIYQSPTIVNAILKHCRDQVDLFNKGFDRWQEEQIFGVDENGRVWKIVDSDIDRLTNISSLADIVELPEPGDPSTFPTRFEWMRARAKWVLQKNQLLELQKQRSAIATTSTQLVKRLEAATEVPEPVIHTNLTDLSDMIELFGDQSDQVPNGD